MGFIRNGTLWNRLIGPAQQRFREARARRILERFPEIQGSEVVDLGGSLPFWNLVGHILKPASVRIYNTSDGRMTMKVRNLAENIVAQVYDGERIPEQDASADFVLCNSVIEHVPPQKRKNFSREICRVGRHHIVQTPSPMFPIDLHFGLPFLHWLPRSLGRHLAMISPFALLSDGDPRGFFEETQLLSRAELQGYFPASEIVTETSLGIPKSLIVFGRGGVID